MDNLTQKAELFGKLLAASPLAEEFKQFLLDHLEEFDESDLDLMIGSLTNEAEMVDRVAKDFNDFEESKPEREEAYAEMLQKRLDSVYERFVKETDKEIDILALRAELEA